MRMRLRSLRDVDGATQGSATVTYSLVDKSDDSVIASGTLPVTSAPDGHYWATLDKSVTALIVEDGQYRLTYTVVSGTKERDFVIELYGSLATS